VTVNDADVGCLRIVQPTGSVPLGTHVSPQSWVRNFGAGAQVFNVRFAVTNGYADTVRNVSVPGGESLLVTAVRSWTASPGGTFAVTCSTMLTGDLNPANNRALDSVRVALHDVGPSRILAPTGFVLPDSSYWPRAFVRNWGDYSETFSLFMSIGAGYVDTFRVTVLPPGESVGVSFDRWVPESLGVYVVRCWTALAADSNRTNDTLTDSCIAAIRDVSVRQIVAPTSPVESGSVVVPQVTYENLGTAAETFWTYFYIHQTDRFKAKSHPNGRADAAPLQLYTDSAEVTIDPGDAATVSYESWTASPVGRLTMQAVAVLPEDADPGNNELREGLEVVPGAHDVGVVAILAPVDTVDSADAVRPVAVITNHTPTSENITVYFNIASGYADTLRVTLRGEDTDTLIFDTWNATRVGTFEVRCTVALAGDVNPTDNVMYDTVVVIPWTGISEVVAEPLPRTLSLAARPNPSAGRTAFACALPRPATLALELYDATGTLVRTLAAGPRPAGRHNVTWDGRDGSGRLMPEGIYYCRMTADSRTVTTKVILQR
jgi:hypothetical protein